MTVGIDDYHTRDEVYVEDEPSAPEENPQISDLPLLDEGEEDFDRVVSKLEVFVIRDQNIFNRTVDLAGAPTHFKHPDEINDPMERWIDLRGDKFIYLKVTYDKLSKVKKPITDLNFYKISKYQGQENKM